MSNPKIMTEVDKFAVLAGNAGIAMLLLTPWSVLPGNPDRWSAVRTLNYGSDRLGV
ncbi:MAG TPA: hypothetical protein VFF87_10925 [Hyphomicrobium sp.]|nr:hypothetical protein [Hyphomicrobium sp.]